MGCRSPTPGFPNSPDRGGQPPGTGCRRVASRGYLAAAGVVVNDLGGDGVVRMGEEHLRVAV